MINKRVCKIRNSGYNSVLKRGAEHFELHIDKVRMKVFRTHVHNACVVARKNILQRTNIHSDHWAAADFEFICRDPY